MPQQALLTDMNLLLSAIEVHISKFRHKLPPSLREYHQFREDLYTIDGVIIYKNHVVIPANLRAEVPSSLHAAHRDVTSMTARAEASVFWSDIITATRATCAQCNRMAVSQLSAPPTPIILLSHPFQCICADLFTYKGVSVCYICIPDRYSNWLIIEKTVGGAKGLIVSLRRTFAAYGIPDELASDGGTEFTSQ